MSETATKSQAKPAKLGAEKLTPEEQKRRFIEAAQAAERARKKPSSTRI